MWKKKLQGDTGIPGWLINLAGRLRRADRRLTEWLNRKSVTIPIQVMRAVLMVYLVFSAAVLTAVIWYEHDLKKPINIQQVTLPSLGHAPEKRINPADLSFRHYMDSVLEDATLNAHLDSLRRARLGFADTLRRLEEIYK